MEIVDAQIHLWEESAPPGRAWDANLAEAFGDHMQNPLTIEKAIVAMDVVGIDAAVLNAVPWYRREVDGFYRYDNSYAEEAASRYPDRLASVGRLDPADPDIENRLAQLMSGPGVVGIRIVASNPKLALLLRDGGFERMLSAAEQQEVPVWIMVQPQVDLLQEVGRSHPDLSLIVDHMGLSQPGFAELGPDPFARLPDVLALAAFPNFALKLTAAPTLSHESYPFSDLWPHVHKIIDAFGPERLMWGSDFTRVRKFVTYAEGIDYIRYTNELSDSDKELILGGTLRRVFNWPAPSRDAAGD